MQEIQTVEYEQYYHIYNRGINSCNIFNKSDNYTYFLKLYEKHISPIADTFAWVLMPNHFHFLVRIKEKGDFVCIPDRVPNPVRDTTPSKHFSNLFNAYAQAFNKQSKRHGGLFERPFKRKRIDTEKYLKSVLIYIHNNPVHHGFVDQASEYPWSSYSSFISSSPSKLQQKTVINWYEDIQNFIYLHRMNLGYEEMENYFD